MSKSKFILKDALDKVFNSKCIHFFGHCPAIDEYLQEKKGWRWFVPDFVHCLARGISQISFSNNPMTGIMVLIGLFTSQYTIGLGALVGASVSVATAKILYLEKSLISSGLTTYNGALIGIITTSLLEPLYFLHLTPYIWGFIVVGAIISVIFNSCIGNLLSSPKHLLPTLTIVFNVLQLVIFTCLLLPEMPESEELKLKQNLTKSEFLDENNQGLDILEFSKGLVYSVGQAHGIQNFWASLIIMGGICIYSPLHLLIGVFGAGLGSLCGIILGSQKLYSQIYVGIWGYNGYFAMVAIGSIFFLPTIQSFAIAALNVVFAAIVQRAFQPAFSALNLPYLTIPYNLTTLIFLQLRGGNGHPILIKNISFPEKHLYQYYIESGLKRNSTSNPNLGGDAELSAHGTVGVSCANNNTNKFQNRN